MLNLPDVNILRFDGPIDHLFLRPLGLQRCPPAPPVSEAKPQVDIDAFLHQHAPAFEKFVAWQKDSILRTEATIKTAERARDAAEFKQWAALGTLLPATGFLATTYAMMFTFPFIVPGAILFVTTSVFIAVVVGYAQRAGSQYTEANDTCKQAAWTRDEQQKALLAAEGTYARLQAQFAEAVVTPGGQSAQGTASSPVAPPAPKRRPRRAHADTKRDARLPKMMPSASSTDFSDSNSSKATSSTASSSTSSAGTHPPASHPWYSQMVPSPSMFGYRYNDAPSFHSSVSSLSLPSAASASPVPAASQARANGAACDAVDAWASVT